jgi:glycosyltransferase involved in cell wall biosynthesis
LRRQRGKIVFAHHLSMKSLGGGEVWTAETAKAMKALGYEVSVCATPVKVASGAPANPADILGEIEYTEKYRQSINADICYITYHPSVSLNFKQIAGKRILGIHATTCFDSSIDLKYGLLPNSAILLHKILGAAEFNKAQAIHTVAPYLKLKHPNVFAIPNYVDSKKFHAYPKANKFTVAFASRKSYQKGWDIFEQFTKLCNKLYPEIQIVSSGNLKSKEVPQFLAQAHVVLVPSRYDSFGLSIVEAAMCETTVVTTPIPSHLSLGLPLRYADDPKAYLRAVAALYTDYELINRNKELRRRAVELYDYPVVINKLDRMFQTLLGE